MSCCYSYHGGTHTWEHGKSTDSPITPLIFSREMAKISEKHECIKSRGIHLVVVGVEIMGKRCDEGKSGIFVKQ